MTNHGNGTYSFNYNVTSNGNISVQIYLLEQGKVYQEFYSGTSLVGTITKSNEVDYLNFNEATSGFYGSGKDNISARLISFIKFQDVANGNLSYD